MFERHPVPTSMPVGPVNCYVAGRTVVDPGPATDDAWEAVTEALGTHDLAPGDVERVILTHTHPDHVGLAGRLHDHGASVLASPETAAFLADVDATLDRDEAFFADLFTRHGMPGKEAQTVASLTGALRPIIDDCPVDRVLTGGETITVDGTAVDVDLVTGHAEEELVFAYDDGPHRAAIVGDHVLDHITPNPLLHRPVERDVTQQGAVRSLQRSRPLPRFNDSLDALRDESFDRFLPGHGPVVDAPRARIEAIRQAHEDRTATVADLVDGPTTAYEVMAGLFEDLPPQERYPGMSEAIGHLDVLEARGAVTPTDGADGCVIYEPV